MHERNKSSIQIPIDLIKCIQITGHYFPLFCSLSNNTPPPPPPTFIFDFSFFLILASALGSNSVGPQLNIFPDPAGQLNLKPKHKNKKKKKQK